MMKEKEVVLEDSAHLLQLDEGFLDTVKSFVGELLGTAQDAFNSAESEAEPPPLEVPPAKKSEEGEEGEEGEEDKGTDEFDPREDPFDQVAAILGMLETINEAVAPFGSLPHGITGTAKEGRALIDEIKTIADGTHPHMEYARGLADNLEGGAMGDEGLDDAWELMQYPYERIVEDISNEFGEFVSTLENVEFVEADWYQKIRQIAKSAKPGNTSAETVENWAKAIGEIERLKPAEQATMIIDSEAVANALQFDERREWLKSTVNKVRTQIGRYDKIEDLKSIITELHQVMEELDKAMGKGAEFLEAASDTEEEREKVAQVSIMSHYERRISKILLESFEASRYPVYIGGTALLRAYVRERIQGGSR